MTSGQRPGYPKYEYHLPVREVLNAGLRKLKATSLDSRPQSAGICTPVIESLYDWLSEAGRDEARELLKSLCRAWPQGSGSGTHPVQDKRFPGDPFSAYRSAQNHSAMWRGDYGERRMMLLDWLIKETS